MPGRERAIGTVLGRRKEKAEKEDWEGVDFETFVYFHTRVVFMG